MNRETESLIEEIYDILKAESGWIRVRVLADRLGMDGRELRAHGEEDSILDEASRRIFRDHGLVVLRRMSPGGVKLSCDPVEIEAVIAQWASFTWRTKRISDEYRESLQSLQREKQTRLAI